jgi:hypothetical protein
LDQPVYLLKAYNDSRICIKGVYNKKEVRLLKASLPFYAAILDTNIIKLNAE